MKKRDTRLNRDNYKLIHLDGLVQQLLELQERAGQAVLQEQQEQKIKALKKSRKALPRLNLKRMNPFKLNKKFTQPDSEGDDPNDEDYNL